ncbi:hypothetical protein THAOC_35748 [Thalassiosira oceanica]|uniref:Uncharacterized protein n=1 Tax=Thalassiosira oceanica TaxID=159749 RepID=K0R9P1_THAOC|nr:hypothetical protein THAOC_35748 [Thalassiosira oceanica]|eukprot:EJK45631.1 hypothetical protein THAOC_35748 [Thalassiosira oceanica]
MTSQQAVLIELSQMGRYVLELSLGGPPPGWTDSLAIAARSVEVQLLRSGCGPDRDRACGPDRNEIHGFLSFEFRGECGDETGIVVDKALSMMKQPVASILLLPLGGCLCFTRAHPALPIPTTARPPRDSRFERNEGPYSADVTVDGTVPVTKQRRHGSPFRTISRRLAVARDLDDGKRPPSQVESLVANAKDIFNFGRNMKLSNKKYLTAITAGLA